MPETTDVLHVLSVLPSWLVMVVGLLSAGALWGVRTTNKKINGAFTSLQNQINTITGNCMKRPDICLTEINVILESRRKLFTEIVDSKLKGIEKSVGDNHDMLIKMMDRINNLR